MVVPVVVALLKQSLAWEKKSGGCGDASVAVEKGLQRN